MVLIKHIKMVMAWGWFMVGSCLITHFELLQTFLGPWLLLTPRNQRRVVAIFVPCAMFRPSLFSSSSIHSYMVVSWNRAKPNDHPFIDGLWWISLISQPFWIPPWLWKPWKNPTSVKPITRPRKAPWWAHLAAPGSPGAFGWKICGLQDNHNPKQVV